MTCSHTFAGDQVGRTVSISPRSTTGRNWQSSGLAAPRGPPVDDGLEDLHPLQYESLSQRRRADRMLARRRIAASAATASSSLINPPPAGPVGPRGPTPGYGLRVAPRSPLADESGSSV
jgi:hypothetical protein